MKRKKLKEMLMRSSMIALSTAILSGGISVLPVFAVDNSANANIATNAAVTNPVDTQDDWLHAKGNRLYDENNNEVWLTGANWFGFNCSESVFHGIWSANLRETIKGIADHGINLVRIPVSTELLYGWMTGNPKADINVNWYANPELVKDDGTKMNSLEVFEKAMELFKEYGIKVMVDIHSPDADNCGHNYELWYGKAMSDGTMVTTDIWIDTWVWLIDKFKDDDTLIAADLKNEPHGKRGYSAEQPEKMAKWDDSTDENNWKYAAERCAKEILKVNPKILIMVEGIEQTPKEGYTYADSDKWQSDDVYNGAWWGGNLRGVRDYPIDLGQYQSQLVYSPHDYGPLVYNQKWFDKDFTEQTLLDDYWYDTWAYIEQENIAPLLMGEWGGSLDGGDNEKWLNLLADYMKKHRINHTFWCLNPNSGDTGGLWGYDFSTWDEKKYAILEKTLWQTDDGKFIGLDHKTPLGKNGISVSKYYNEPETPSTPSTVVNVENVALDKTEALLEVGKTIDLTATVSPENASNKKVTFSSDNEEVATVDANGKVTAKKAGSAVITVTSEDGSKTAKCNVTVKAEEKPEVVKVQSVSLNKNNMELKVGGTENLAATVNPSNAANKNVTFSSDNEEVATVDANGKVTAKKAGSAVITVTTENGSKTASCKVTVKAEEKPEVVKVQSVSLNKNNVELKVGGTENLVATVNPSNAANKNVTFSSDNKDVATVDMSGKVTARKAGSAVITVTSEDGNKTASCKVTVANPSQPAQVIPVKNINLDSYYIELRCGKTVKLNADTLPSNATNKEIIWKSGDDSVATVDKDGNITGVKVGSTNIIASTADGTCNAYCFVNVNNNSKPIISSAWLNNYWQQMNIGDQCQLKLFTSPNSSEVEINWTSSDENVVKVDKNGLVTSVGSGNASVTATVEGTNISATSQFVVR